MFQAFLILKVYLIALTIEAADNGAMAKNGRKAVAYWAAVSDGLSALGKNRGWLSEQADIPYSTLTRWIGEGKAPESDKAERIAELLGFNPEEVVKDETPDETGDLFWRNARGLFGQKDETIRGLSQKTGIPYSTLRRLMLVGKSPTLNEANKIARALGTTVAELVGNSDRMPSGGVPLWPQSFSCGPGETLEPQSAPERFPVPELVAGGRKLERLEAVRVAGDSMTGAGICHGDIAVFERGLVDGDGIYVVLLRGEGYVKRVQANPMKGEVILISDNPRYQPVTVKNSEDGFQLLGKVVGWVHREA